MFGRKPSYVLIALVAELLVLVPNTWTLADEPARWKLPKGNPPLSHLIENNWYPPVSSRMREQGHGVVEFGILPTGYTANVRAIPSTEWSSRLQEAASKYISVLRFNVADNWSSSGGPSHRFRVSFVFVIRPCPDAGTCELPTPFASDYSLTVISAVGRNLDIPTP